MEFSPVSFTILRVNGGPEHANAWQRTGSFYLPVPPPPAPASFPTAALAERPSSLQGLRGCLHDGSPTRQSIACPELDFVPIELWGMEGSTALGRSPWPSTLSSLGQHQERVKHRSARLWLCVLVCDHGHFQKLREAKPGEEKHPFVLFCIYSFAHFLIHSLNYSLLKQGYGFII